MNVFKCLSEAKTLYNCLQYWQTGFYNSNDCIVNSSNRAFTYQDITRTVHFHEFDESTQRLAKVEAS